MRQYRSILTHMNVSLLFVCNAQNLGEIKPISALDFNKMINSTFRSQIPEVRTREEFQSDHMVNAKNSNWLGTNFENDTKT